MIAQRGRVFAVEKDLDNIGVLERNVERLGTDNIEIVAAEAPAALDSLPDPDSVFIGGSGGNLPAILQLVGQRPGLGGRSAPLLPKPSRSPLRGQITKREVRAVSLYSLGLRQDSVVWDIGAQELLALFANLPAH